MSPAAQSPGGRGPLHPAVSTMPGCNVSAVIAATAIGPNRVVAQRAAGSSPRTECHERTMPQVGHGYPVMRRNGHVDGR